ncbi:ribosomal protein L27 [Babesia ovata]|uniref:Ribosomal protein L27 n=1 Tax=Babesia ovata TaxID=189622 RepID=A0A2H6KH58_9APIC|nr:ribosomal protein L27 [Babesia ovata]GBE62324.1 ribosomal protein L27 [Babesia ovata]
MTGPGSSHCRPVVYAQGTGSTKNGRDSNPKFLGIKKCHNSFAFVGNIIVRQRGAKFKCGIGTKMGRDHTIYAVKSGRVQILNHRVSVLDLVAERAMLSQQHSTSYFMEPTLYTLSKLWTEKADKVNK